MKRTKLSAAALGLSIAFIAASAIPANATVEVTGPHAVHQSAVTEQPAPVDGEEYKATSSEDGLFGAVPGSDGGEGTDALRAPNFVGQVQADWPHVSSQQASGHVWWKLISGPSQKVKVTSTLKARTSWLTFATMAGPTAKDIYPGGGAGKFAVARHTCTGVAKRDWYTYGEAFAPGYADPFGAHSSATKELLCQ